VRVVHERKYQLNCSDHLNQGLSLAPFICKLLNQNVPALSSVLVKLLNHNVPAISLGRIDIPVGTEADQRQSHTALEEKYENVQESVLTVG